MSLDFPPQPTIIIADDEPGVRRLVVEIITSSIPQAKFIEAGNGKEALDLVRSTNPDLVILDIMMPLVDGYAVLDDLRVLRSSDWMPVVIMTGFGDQHLEADLFRIGADSYLEKPVGQLKLQGTVWALLRLKARCDELRVQADRMGADVDKVVQALDRESGIDADGLLNKALIVRS